MSITIALVGNPNSGKTTIFNLLTGSNQFVGNWPGVTVEKKEGRLKGHQEVVITDLPGIYSLSPYTLEEVITRDYLLETRPDVIINLVDAANLERNLYLTTQLAELGIPVVMALNMMDLLKKRGDIVDVPALAAALGCEVVETAAVRGEGIDELARRAVALAKNREATPPTLHHFSPQMEAALEQIDALACEGVPAVLRRWTAVKLFERDARVLEKTPLAPQLEELIAACEREMDDDSESLIINGRYEAITDVTARCLRRLQTGPSLSERIDRVVTNRVLALPIFVLVMFFVYAISVSTVGNYLTGFTNDVLFGSILQPAVQGFLESIGTSVWLTGLVVDGIIGGVGAVLGFVPQMLVLFLLLCVLEDCGYMARVAFIMDRLFRRLGLSGKSFIPMLIGSGCSVPGIMASRTIEQERDRRMTIMTTSFIPCGAKMPIVALIAGAMFGGAWWVAPSAYFIGIGAVIVSGLILKKTKLFAGKPAPFVMELPPYHLPTVLNVLRGTWERGWSFIRKAGTVILLASIAVWFLSSFGVVGGGLHMVEDMDHSVLAVIGGAIAGIFAPLGFGNWQSAVATVLGLLAKEEVVGVFGVLYGVSGDALALVEEGAFGDLGAISAQFTALSAYAFLIFNLLCAPCFAAIGAIRREMNSARWTWFALGYQTLLAYTISLIVYQLGLFFTGGAFGVWTAAAFVLLAGYLWLLLRRGHTEPRVRQLRPAVQRG